VSCELEYTELNWAADKPLKTGAIVRLVTLIVDRLDTYIISDTWAVAVVPTIITGAIFRIITMLLVLP